MEAILNWAIDNWVENLGVLTGILYIILSVRQNIWCWIFGIISSGVYLVVFFNSKIYADMSLQLYYVIMGVYGWMHWARVDSSQTKGKLPVLKLNMRSATTLFVITTALFFIIAWVLIQFTDSPVPWIDAFTTSLSFTATWMLARKIIEHWIIWIVVDAVSIGLYFHRGLYSSMLLFGVLTALAIYGYFEWRKEWKKNQPTLALL